MNPDDNSLLENRCGLLDYRNELVDEDCTPKDKKPFICEQIKSMKCQTYRCGVIDVFYANLTSFVVIYVHSTPLVVINATVTSLMEIYAILT